MGGKAFPRAVMVGIVATAFLGSTLNAKLSTGPRATLLPEIATHLQYAEKCAKNNWVTALQASRDVLSPQSITVYVPENVKANRVQAFFLALREWERSLNYGVRFTLVDSPSEASVTVKFVDSLKIPGGEAGGYASWKRSVTADRGVYKGAVTAQIQLAAKAGGSELCDKALKHAALHEVGHVLGLDDSDMVGGVMGPLDLYRPVTSPTWNEIQALRKVRNDVQQIWASVAKRRDTF